MQILQLSFADAGTVALLAYVLGSVPAGIVVTWAMRLPDPRTIGSQNIGTTNVLRTGSRLAAALTLIGDGGKGFLAVLLGSTLAGPGGAWLAGATVFIGHLFPVWLRFRGGKGVATFLGIALAFNFPAGLGACLAWLAVAAAFRFSSLSALVAAVVAPLLITYAEGVEAGLVTAGLAACLWIRHAANIRRLLGRREPRIGKI